jgi:hypothetical protein
MDQSFNNAVTSQDAIKFGNIDENLSRFTTSGYDLTIETRAFPLDGESLQLNINNYRLTEYTFKVAGTNLMGMDALLYDNFTGEATVLSSDQETLYSFSVNSSNALSAANDRFELRFATQTLGLGDDNSAFAKAVQLYPNPASNGVLNISMPSTDGATLVTMYNMQGQQVKTTRNTTRVISLETNDLASGVYVVKIINGDQEANKQVVVNN